MNYKIQYDAHGRAKHKFCARHRRGFQYFAGIVAVIGILSLLISGEWGNILDSLELMSKQLQQGSELEEAFTCFCLDILQGSTQ